MVTNRDKIPDKVVAGLYEVKTIQLLLYATGSKNILLIRVVFKVDMKLKFLFLDMKVQEKLKRKLLPFLLLLLTFPSSRDINVQRSVKWHKK